MKNSNINISSELSSFVSEIGHCNSKKHISELMFKTFEKIFPLNFSSFVERGENSLTVICQLGDSSSVMNVFTKELSEQIFDLVIKKRQLVSMKLADSQQFVFVPVVDKYNEEEIIHGMFVLHLSCSDFEINNDLSNLINVFSTFVSVSMTRVSAKNDKNKYLELKKQVNSELDLTAKVQKSISGIQCNNKLLFSVLADDNSTFNGNMWWLNNLSSDISLILIAQILCKGAPAALLGGFLLGEMSFLKTDAGISLHPEKVLKYLNKQLNPVFKSTGITFNAWYGVLNLEARKVKFANANHPNPFLIGSEQQVSTLDVGLNTKGEPLGVNLNSHYEEHDAYIADGSRLVICTSDLIEQAARIGNKYDPTWLPQVLETIGSLSLTEMRNSLESILSEKTNGTAKKGSRLALLLEISS